MIGLILVSIIFIVSVIFFLHKKKDTYLEKAGVPSPPSVPLVGHAIGSLMKSERWKTNDKYYKTYKRDGMFVLYEMGTPNLYLCDLNLVRDVMVKEFDHFTDRRDIGTGDTRFEEMMSTLKGTAWKSLRSLLTPTFTSGKIKGMFDLVSQNTDNFIHVVDEHMAEKGYVDAKLLLGFYTMDVIATCAFGIDAGCLIKKDASTSKFLESANRIMSPSISMMIKFVLMITFPNASRKLGITFEKRANDFLEGVVLKTMKERIDSGVKRGDFLDLLIELKKECEDDKVTSKYDFTTNTIVSQSILYLLAGFDTTSISMAATVYFLAKNLPEQTKLREELQKAFQKEDDFNYQNLFECHYLDAVISESMRLLSPTLSLDRCCTADFKIPDKDITIKKGTIVTMLPHSYHNDGEYWENPEEFHPERFLPENKRNIVPFSYMPFGQGPRNCIASRFALMNAKICLAKMFLQFHVSLKPGHEEIKFDSNTYDSIKPADDGVRVVVEKVVRDVKGDVENIH